MKLHPLLDGAAVLVSRTPVGAAVNSEDFRRAAWQALAAMRVEVEGENVVLKPNLTSGEHIADPYTGITTHPAFVQGMIEYLQQHGMRSGACFVLEDPRNSDDDEPRHWRGTGFPELAKATGAALCTPTTSSCVKNAVPRPRVHPVLRVDRRAASPAAILINVPKLKTHPLGITTLCLKNLMGAVYVADRHYCAQAWQELPPGVRDDPRPHGEWVDRALHRRWQEGLARRLVDTAQVVPSPVNIVEGVIGREGTGFQRGRNRPLGLVVAGRNPVAVDSIASYLMGFDPQELVYLNLAAEAGLGTNDLRAIAVYEDRDGTLVPCCDLGALRADPPFRVLSEVMGEPPWDLDDG